MGSGHKLNGSKADDRVIADAIQFAEKKSGQVVLATDDNNVLLVARDLANKHGFQVVSRKEMFA